MLKTGDELIISVERKERSKFGKKRFRVGDKVYFKGISDDPESNNVKILVTEDKEGKSKSYGFYPDEVKYPKQDSE